jgi:hypothetical protein
LKQQNDIRALLAMLENEPDWMDVLDAAEALAQLGDPRGLERLIQTLGDPDPDVREVAREILTELNDPRGNEALQQPYTPAAVVFQQPVSKFKLFVSFLVGDNWRKIVRITLFLTAFFAAAFYLGGGAVFYLLVALPVYSLFPVGMLAIPYLFLSRPFPDGQARLIMSAPGVLIVLAGWSVYFLIIRFGVKAKKTAIFVVIYILFLLLLFGNVAGCTLQQTLFGKFM